MRRTQAFSPSKEGTAGPSELVRSLEDIHMRLSKFREKFDRIDLELDTLLVDVKEYLALLGFHSPLSVDGEENGKLSFESLRLSPERVKVLEFLATDGASRLEIEWGVKGRAHARLGDSRAFYLPPKLALLLSIIGRGKKDPHDGFVSWMSLEAVAVELQKLSGDKRRVKPHAVTELVRRLRARLFRNHVNPYLVETLAGRGVRLRLKDSKATASRNVL